MYKEFTFQYWPAGTEVEGGEYQKPVQGVVFSLTGVTVETLGKHQASVT